MMGCGGNDDDDDDMLRELAITRPSTYHYRRAHSRRQGIRGRYTLAGFKNRVLTSRRCEKEVDGDAWVRDGQTVVRVVGDTTGARHCSRDH